MNRKHGTEMNAYTVAKISPLTNRHKARSACAPVYSHRAHTAAERVNPPAVDNVSAFRPCRGRMAWGEKHNEIDTTPSLCSR